MSKYVIHYTVHILALIALLIKVIFVLSTILFYYFDKTNNIDFYVYFLYWKNRTEFIYQICVAIVLIFIFNPFDNFKNYITKELSITLFLSGLFVIIGADWSEFIYQHKIKNKIIEKKKNIQNNV